MMVGTIDLSSSAFAQGSRLPMRFTPDGEDISPPIVCAESPKGTEAFALIVTDANSGCSRDVGRNCFLSEGWLPPDPPPRHGEHDYVFQLVAFSERPLVKARPKPWSPCRGDSKPSVRSRCVNRHVFAGRSCGCWPCRRRRDRQRRFFRWPIRIL